MITIKTAVKGDVMFWQRNDNNAWVSSHFKPKEFQCSDGVCQSQIIDRTLINLLDVVRDIYGAPITVNSGYRCANRQEQLRKQGYETAVGISSHEMGQAADITGTDMKALGEAIHKVFANYSIGTAKTFYHVDIRTGGPRRWSYTT